MKVCSYCGTENPDNSVICENCGAHEFKHKCNNCGTIYDEGAYCPKCGVKAGQRPRVCPKCGREYFSNACPTCGYVRGGRETDIESQVRTTARDVRSTAVPVKKRKTWLWVLGWLFIFPLPLTILLLRNKKMNKVVKIVILVIAWLFYLLIALGANSNSSTDSSTSTDKPAPTQAVTSDNTATSDNSEPKSADATQSADEPIATVEEPSNPSADLDAFVDSFNAAGGIQIVSKEQIDIHDKSGGYYRTEFRLNAYDGALAYHVVFEDGSSADLIDTANWSSGETVNGSIDRIYVLASSIESFESLFRTACKVMHPDSITDADIDKELDEMMHPYRYEEMEYLYSSGSGVIGSKNESFTYSIKAKQDYFDFFLD